MAYNIKDRIDSIFGGKNREAERRPVLQDKINKAYGNTNPFVKKDGSLVNPYINYQKLMDGENTSDRAKMLIAQATGLVPSQTQNSRAMQSSTIKASPAVPITGEQTTAKANTIVDSAKKFLGTPYVWGGESMAEGGMDCSGFVYNALKGAGYNVGRDTAQGYRKLGTAVNKSDLQEGDLIFFGTGDKATHIGIYIGNGQMIHSSGGSKNTKDNPGKGVSIANVDYRSDFLEARRY